MDTSGKSFYKKIKMLECDDVMYNERLMVVKCVFKSELFVCDNVEQGSFEYFCNTDALFRRIRRCLKTVQVHRCMRNSTHSVVVYKTTNPQIFTMFKRCLDNYMVEYERI